MKSPNHLWSIGPLEATIIQMLIIAFKIDIVCLCNQHIHFKDATKFFHHWPWFSLWTGVIKVQSSFKQNKAIFSDESCEWRQFWLYIAISFEDSKFFFLMYIDCIAWAATQGIRRSYQAIPQRVHFDQRFKSINKFDWVRRQQLWF